MYRAIRAAALAFTVGASLTLVAATPGPAGAAPKPPKPVVSRVAPSSGPTSGGTKVTIRGKNLKTATKVLFGPGKGTKLKVVSDKKLTVLTPAHAAGKVKIQVTTKGGKSAASAKATFTFLAPPPPPPPPPAPPATPPTVTAVNPPSGPQAGGTPVTVTGTNLAGATSVSFGGVAATPSAATATSVKVIAPAHAFGVVDVRVTTAAGTSAVAAGATFQYVAAPPTVNAVNPTTGPVGTVVTVTGTNLTGATQVTFGGTPGTALSVGSATSLTVTAPTHALGAADVRVITPAGQSGAGAVSFTYVAAGAPPVVEAVDPASGPATGGAAVTVFGTGLSGATQVSFGTTPGTNVVVVADDQLTVTSPAHAVGVVDVRVTTPAGTSAAVPEGEFTYLAPDSRAYSAPLPGDADTDGQGAALNAVDCPAVQQCFAVGNYLSGGTRVPLAEQRVGADSWQPYRPDLPADAALGADVGLEDVDCASPTFCVAIGTYLDNTSEFLPLIETWDGAGWSPSSPTLPVDNGFSEETVLSDVECPAVGSCVAVGRYQESVNDDDVPLLLELSGGTWTVKPLGTPGGSVGELDAVDCPTAASCVAVGSYTAATTRPFVATGPSTWEVNSALPLPGNADTDPRAGLRAVACSAAGSCLAVGSYRTSDSKDQGLAAVLGAGSWTATAAPAPVGTGTATNPQVQLDSVSCASTCAGVGHYSASLSAGGGLRPLLVRLSGTSVVSERGPLPAGVGAETNSSSTTVVCSSGSRCLGLGYYDDGSGSWTPLLSSLNTTTWTASEGVSPDDLDGVVIPASSALDGQVGVAVGLYNDSAGQQALLMVDLPVGP